VKSSAKKGGMRNFSLIELEDIGKSINNQNNKKDYDDFLELYKKMYENSMESNRKEVTNLILTYYDKMNTKLHNLIFRMSKNQKLKQNSEYQKLYKKIEKVKEDVVEAMMRSQEELWGDPMEEARLIQQNNSNLIYAFLRLCGYAFTKENRDEIYKKLKTLLEKEIKYREKIIRLIQNEEMMTFLANSLIDLKYISEFVDKTEILSKTKNLNQKRKIHANYIGLGLYRNEYRQNHPNIKINDLPSHNKYRN
jgi:hypothetical protein